MAIGLILWMVVPGSADLIAHETESQPAFTRHHTHTPLDMEATNNLLDGCTDKTEAILSSAITLRKATEARLVSQPLDSLPEPRSMCHEV